MRRLLTASVLLALALVTTAATGQPPKPDDLIQQAKQREIVEKQRERAQKDAADAVIAAALANDPDVKMARAKIQLAEAELAKARLAVTQRVVVLKTTIEQHKATVAVATEQYAMVKQRAENGASPRSELLDAQLALQRVQGTLATAEAEWRLLTGGAVAAATDPAADKVLRVWGGLDDLATAEDANKVARLLDYHRAVMLHARAAVKGPIPDRIRAALDKPVKLGAANEKVTFEQAVEAFKKVGLDVPVRAEFKLGPVVSLGEELPVGAWFQLFADGTPDVRIVVREYGLLVTRKDVAPPDAPGVVEFWKQRPPAKDVRPDVKAEPKPK